MKAMVNMRYGPPDVLELTEVERSTPKDDEVLVKVHAASVNPADWHLLRGDPYIARLQLGLRKPKESVLGCDVAGQVEALGKNVTMLKPGDEVFGSPFMHGFGAFAEYVCVSEDLLAPKPTTLSFEQAARARGGSMMSAHATFLPIERRSVDVQGTGSRVPAAGQRGYPGRLHPSREGHRTVGTELRSLWR